MLMDMQDDLDDFGGEHNFGDFEQESREERSGGRRYDDRPNLDLPRYVQCAPVYLFALMTCLATCSVGQIYEGTIVKTQAFGAFVEIRGFKQHGLVHISQLSDMKALILSHICASLLIL